MDFSFKQVAAVMLSALMFSFALFTITKELHQQGTITKEKTNTNYIDYETQLNTQGVVVNTAFKPQYEETIFHMRKGEYSAFSYHTLIHVIDFQGVKIENVKDVFIDGKIDGKTNGVNILYCTVFDPKGNYLRYKIAVIIEGNDSINTNITTYEEGKLI